MKFYTSSFDSSDFMQLIARADACSQRLMRENPALVASLRAAMTQGVDEGTDSP